MPNSKNLKSNSERTPKERKILAQKAGIKSGEVRREKRKLRESIEAALEFTDKASGENNAVAITQALITQAKKGNVKAFEVIRDTIGEKPIDKQEIEVNNDIPDVIIFERDCYEPAKIIAQLKENQGKRFKFCTREECDEFEAHYKKVIGEY